MTDSKQDPSAGPPRGGEVLDPEWEEALRRGQEAEGEAGSVDAELAFVHLLRHSREPEALAPQQLDAIWSAIEAEVAPARVPWWRKAWVWWSAPALAAAAVLVVMVIKPSEQGEATIARQDRAAEDKQERAASAPGQARDDAFEGAAQRAELEAAEAEPMNQNEAEAKPEASAADEDGARGSAGIGGRKGGAGASMFEANFAKLAPHGRLAIRVSVDHSRDELRSQLLAKARGGGR
ncbi:MAG: hypothetical protein R6X02_16490 [Enhygromyxa sp.]